MRDVRAGLPSGLSGNTSATPGQAGTLTNEFLILFNEHHDLDDDAAAVVPATTSGRRTQAWRQ